MLLESDRRDTKAPINQSQLLSLSYLQPSDIALLFSRIFNHADLRQDVDWQDHHLGG